jgi:hypothetical protein
LEGENGVWLFFFFFFFFFFSGKGIKSSWTPELLPVVSDSY